VVADVDQVKLLVDAEVIVENSVAMSFDLNVRIEGKSGFEGDFYLRFSDKLLVKQDLSIQVACVNRIQIDLKKKQKFIIP
jgi:hypothetical protein